MSTVSRFLCSGLLTLGLTNVAAAEPAEPAHRLGGIGYHAARGLSHGGLLP